jgi:hypothetical protein
VYGISIDTTQFVGMSEAPVITTEPLLPALDMMETVASDDAPSVREAREAKVKYILNDCRTFINGLENPSDKPLSEVLLSAQLLCHTIHHHKSAKSIRILRTLAFSSLYLKSKLVELGHCRHKAAMLYAQYTVQVQYYVYLLGQPKTSVDHSNCTEDLCVYTQIESDSVQSQHTRWCGDGSICSFYLPFTHMRDPRASDKILPLSEASFEPDRTKIQGILARGGIPLLSLSDPYSLNSPRVYDIEPDVVEYEPGIRYVAISHVWAAGLGNN